MSIDAKKIFGTTSAFIGESGKDKSQPEDEKGIYDQSTKELKL